MEQGMGSLNAAVDADSPATRGPAPFPRRRGDGHAAQHACPKLATAKASQVAQEAHLTTACGRQRGGQGRDAVKATAAAKGRRGPRRRRTSTTRRRSAHQAAAVRHRWTREEAQAQNAGRVRPTRRSHPAAGRGAPPGRRSRLAAEAAAAAAAAGPRSAGPTVPIHRRALRVAAVRRRGHLRVRLPASTRSPALASTRASTSPPRAVSRSLPPSTVRSSPPVGRRLRQSRGHRPRHAAWCAGRDQLQPCSGLP